MKIKVYEFIEPVKLVNWKPPQEPGVYAITCVADSVKNPSTHTPLYFGESGDFSERGFPWNHHAADCWVKNAGTKDNVYISVYIMPNSSEEMRNRVETELIQYFDPPCNKVKKPASSIWG